MKRPISLAIFCAFSVCIQAQRPELTTINACAQGAENRTARLYLEDAITRFQWKVDEQPIDENGCFQLSVELPETQKAVIKIDFYHTFIYLQPGENYRIIYDSFDFRIDERVNPQRLNQFLSYRFETVDTNELNHLIWRFENMHDRFLVENYTDEGFTREAYNAFRALVQRVFAYSGHAYFLAYKNYALADLARVFRLIPPTNLFFTHVEDKPILYNNVAYADFITGFYSGYFPHQVRYNRNLFVQQINRADNLPAIMDSLGRDTTLQNEKLREFVFLLGLREMYHNHEFRRTSVLRLLHEIRETSKFHEHTVLANSIIKSLQRFEPGIHQANFKFADPERRVPYDFSESSKFKYVLFVNGLCESCDAEISILQDIAGRHRETVDFYVVNCDYEVNRSLRNRPRDLQNITYLHFNKDFATLENIGIVDYPIAIWLDQNNIIQSFYFHLPSRRAERGIRLLTAEEEE